MPDRVSLTIEDGLAELCLVRTDAHNAIDYDLVEDLLAAVMEVHDDPALRALLICADGRHFTVGGDLAYLAGIGGGLGDELARMITPYHEALATLDELRIPVVTAVQGAAAGGGLGLLYVADTVLLAPDARLVGGFDKLGLSGDGGGTFHLPRLVGLARAVEFQVRGRALDAAAAVEWGIASRIVDGDLRSEARAEARALADGPTAMYAEQRGLLRTPPARAGLQAELEAMRRLGDTEFAQQAVAAFAARA
jgi:2-(1,2-epoxy-1,2-dihydrophenyl)acetyl-CoA isomerase